MDGGDPTCHVMIQACSRAGAHPVTLCAYKRDATVVLSAGCTWYNEKCFSLHLCGVKYIINNMRPLEDLEDWGRILFTCWFNHTIPSHLTQVIQQALNRQPSSAAAQYLQQMYAAQQQHLMLQTAALQQQHLSLAAVQQVGIYAIDIHSGPQKHYKNICFNNSSTRAAWTPSVCLKPNEHVFWHDLRMMQRTFSVHHLYNWSVSQMCLIVFKIFLFISRFKLELN